MGIERKEEGLNRNYVSYVVRVSRDDAGAIHGVVVRVTTGERVGFHGLDGVGQLLRDMVAADISATEFHPGPGGRTPET
jgi:hypothetical protein